MKQKITIGLLIEATKHYWKVIVSGFILSLLAGVLLFVFLQESTFSSKSTITKNNSFGRSNYSNVIVLVHSSSFVDNVSLNLKNKHIQHLDGTTITSIEIENGISISDYNPNNITSYVDIYFQSSYKGISKYVLNEVVNTLVAVLSTSDEFPGIRVFDEPSEEYQIKRSNSLLIPIVSFGGLILSLGISSVVLWSKDVLWDSNDICLLGKEGFYINKNESFESFLSSHPEYFGNTVIVNLENLNNSSVKKIVPHNINAIVTDEASIYFDNKFECETIVLLCEKYKTKRNRLYSLLYFFNKKESDKNILVGIVCNGKKFK